MSSIPKVLYQSWKTKNLPQKIQEAVDKTRALNSDYKYILFDDNDCRQFILDNFGASYADAFDVLIPGAFKCDFWRYAMLYVNGGVYMDLDMTPLVPFKELLKEGDQFVSISDIPHANIEGVYQAFLACVPKHPIMRLSLDISFSNIVTRRTDLSDVLSITGPGVVAVAVNIYWGNKNTNKRIVPGVYPNGLKFFRMDRYSTYDLEGKKIFDNKMDSYKTASYGGPMDALITNYYTDDPRKSIRRRVFYMIIFLFLIAMFGVIAAFYYRRKYKSIISIH